MFFKRNLNDNFFGTKHKFYAFQFVIHVIFLQKIYQSWQQIINQQCIVIVFFLHELKPQDYTSNYYLNTKGADNENGGNTQVLDQIRLSNSLGHIVLYDLLARFFLLIELASSRIRIYFLKVLEICDFMCRSFGTFLSMTSLKQSFSPQTSD